ncbi:hypothetical protein BAE44_0021824 [Dichanthelium oligosanthes]|uniref:Rad60/SUMO-like domain-containing protein n=1 Tax=Dichanthelium oligosanthes TaxID=888268 RepID=A0A1E5UW84_9POAL|nr:hypothetical protein BAE44_0021824 [Dichanthelium oligosanthes]
MSLCRCIKEMEACILEEVPDGVRKMSKETEEAANAEEQEEYVTLKVVDQEGRIVKHSMRTTDELQGVMDKYYAEAPEVGYGTGTFLIDGAVRLRGWKTPADLELDDDAQIDFFPYADGGAWESSDDA